MYIDELELGNVRTFADSKIKFIHPDSHFRSPGANGASRGEQLPRPKLPNVNLLLGDNAFQVHLL
jgi:hypothetical protein